MLLKLLKRRLARTLLEQNREARKMTSFFPPPPFPVSSTRVGIHHRRRGGKSTLFTIGMSTKINGPLHPSFATDVAVSRESFRSSLHQNRREPWSAGFHQSVGKEQTWTEAEVGTHKQNSKHRGERLELILSKYMSRHWALRPASIRELCTIVNLMCCSKGGGLFGMMLREDNLQKKTRPYLSAKRNAKNTHADLT